MIKVSPPAQAKKTDRQIKAKGQDDANILGKRLAYFRKLRMLTLEQVAVNAQITKSHLSKLERGLSSPTIATLLKLAKALHTNAERLIGNVDEHDEIVVVKAKDRLPFTPSLEREGYEYEAIASDRNNKAMMPFITYPPSEIDEKRDLTGHPGEELVFLVHGEMEVVFAKHSIKMNPGDSVYFNATIPHRLKSIGKSTAKALIVITNPISSAQ